MLQMLTRLMMVGVLSMMTLPAFAQGDVARAQFTSGVIDREPIDNIGSVIKVEYGEIQRVYFFTDLRDMAGSEVTHRWRLDDQDQAEIAFDIGGDRWRVWSSKRLMPGFDGKWRVDILRDGQVIESHSFDYLDDY
ncbi:DUF2914 domain-containing protein [Marinomonas algarum]|uniref:DUF2914 domain-containing protein n=1 Tax=Marinomonas algarum TaxID=2883105 RepID=A0A9X1ILJ1_9GAMM|nr:DUF2914 domain-containing protein [Marinomonas algarum]MCB5161463.1 DUF2914 domain-containing protein [Marinomonas algarum]